MSPADVDFSDAPGDVWADDDDGWLDADGVDVTDSVPSAIDVSSWCLGVSVTHSYT